jgi:hypothetical protein
MIAITLPTAVVHSSDLAEGHPTGPAALELIQHLPEIHGASQVAAASAKSAVPVGVRLRLVMPAAASVTGAR